MTLVLANVLETGAVLAADRRISFGTIGGPYQRGDANKLFIVRGCAVASFGTSPPGTDIPTLIRSANGAAPATPEVLAESLYERVQSLPERGEFGLLVLGASGNGYSLFEVSSTSGTYPAPLQAGVLHSRGVAISAELPSPQSLGELRGQFLAIFRQTALQCSDVGPPFETATFTCGSPLVVERSDA